MSAEQYSDLVNDICGRFHIAFPNKESLDEGFSLKVNQILFTLQHDPVFDEDGLLIFCEFSEYPSENVENAFRRLMQVNLISYLRYGPKFSLNPDTGHVILFSRTSLSLISSDLLVLVLLNLSNCAHLWQKYTLLDDAADKEAAFESSVSSLSTKQKVDHASYTSTLFPDLTVQFIDDTDEVPMSDDALKIIEKMTDENANLEATSDIVNALFQLEKDGLFQWVSVS